MKKKLFKLLMVPFLGGITGCGSSVLFKMSVLNENENAIVRTYDYFNGEFTHKKTINKTTAIKVAVITKSGKLSIDIKDSNLTSYYTGNITENASFNVNVPEGKYTFTLSAEEHSGSYSFIWTK